MWGSVSTWRRALLVAVCGAVFFAAELPRAASIHVTRPQGRAAVTFLDRNGVTLGTLLSIDQERTSSVPLTAVAPAFVAAVIAAEDARYFAHGAVDWPAAARALVRAVHARTAPGGASTIAMQLARMVGPSDATPLGKLREIVDATRIEAGSDKGTILEAYVNRLPMGGNLYGVEAAARAYFGVPASELTLAQATLLAAIPNDPVRLDPRRHPAAARARQRYVLGRMVATGAIVPRDAALALAERMHFVNDPRGIALAPQYLFRLAASVGPDASVVRTTVDAGLQRFVETQLRDVVASWRARGMRDAAALVLDNRTGDVLAYAGSPDYFDATILGRNDGVAALRQPGSALKPFLYELALERHAIGPATILADVPTVYAIPGARLYAPSDYSEHFAGPVRVRLALANSLNVPAVRTLSHVGVEPFLDRLHDLGFTHLTHSAEYYGLGLALGGGEVSLWELAHAYRALATGAAPFADPARALVIDMLADPFARSRAFGTHSILDLPFPAAVKTGTSSGFRDVWTVGFTRDETVAVWAGNFDGSGMRDISGVAGAGPIWARIMLHLHEAREPGQFDPPDLPRRPICAQTGTRPAPGCGAIVDEYLFPGELASYDSVKARPLGRDFDTWLATQPPRTDLGLRIVAPRDGAQFVYYPATGDPAQAQRIVCRVEAPRGAGVVWTLQGQRLGATSPTTAIVTLRPGTFHLRVRAGALHDDVTFTVEPRQRLALRRGFSYVR